jgi:hypothetical protein
MKNGDNVKITFMATFCIKSMKPLAVNECQSNHLKRLIWNLFFFHCPISSYRRRSALVDKPQNVQMNETPLKKKNIDRYKRVFASLSERAAVLWHLAGERPDSGQEWGVGGAPRARPRSRIWKFRKCFVMQHKL